LGIFFHQKFLSLSLNLLHFIMAVCYMEEAISGLKEINDGLIDCVILTMRFLVWEKSALGVRIATNQAHQLRE
jgi:hypothetical protein